jgi:DNA-binding NarL/FixJ family response regulator
MEKVMDVNSEETRNAADWELEHNDHELRLLIVDDVDVLRKGLIFRLRRYADIRVVGEAADGEEAITQARRLRPDVILMDCSLPRLDGFEATAQICAELPNTRVIGLSMYEEADKAQAMLDAGAAAYVNKAADLDELLAAIRRAHSPQRTRSI